MFVSTHYAGKDVEMKFEEGEPWKKVFGPIFVYVNSLSNEENASKLWKNAKEQVCSIYNIMMINDSSDRQGIISSTPLIIS